MRLVHHSHLCRGEGHLYSHASHSALSPALNLIKALRLCWGIAPVQRNFTWQRMNDLTHCQRYTALAKSSIWPNRDIHTEERERQGYGCRPLNHIEEKLSSLFFFITHMQIKDINQLSDRPWQITDNWCNHQLAKLMLTVDCLKIHCGFVSWSRFTCRCVRVSIFCTYWLKRSFFFSLKVVGFIEKLAFKWH